MIPKSVLEEGMIFSMAAVTIGLDACVLTPFPLMCVEPNVVSVAKQHSFTRA